MTVSKTVRRGISRVAREKLDLLGSLLRVHDRQRWEIGDLVNQLVQNHRVSLDIVSQKVGYSKSHLSELAATARFFPSDERTANFQDSLLARRIFTRFPALAMPINAIRDEISGLRGKRPGEVKAYFMRRLAEKHKAIVSAHTDFDCPPPFLNRCIHDDWRNVVPTLPNSSVKIFNADPPFGGYRWGGGGGYRSTRATSSGLRTESDANSTEEALEVTLALFDLCLPKLKEGGCLLLWQPGARPDSPIILEKAVSSGWDTPVALTWLKSNTGIVAEDYPYAPTTERLLVFVPQGMKLVKHEYDLSRSDVLMFPSETIQASRDIRSGKRSPQDVHMFQKPTGLMEHLLRKHSHVGETIVDCFGCSGSACLAAQNLNRKWVYIERNLANFRWGSERLIRSLVPR